MEFVISDDKISKLSHLVQVVMVGQRKQKGKTLI